MPWVAISLPIIYDYPSAFARPSLYGFFTIVSASVGSQRRIDDDERRLRFVDLLSFSFFPLSFGSSSWPSCR